MIDRSCTSIPSFPTSAGSRHELLHTSVAEKSALHDIERMLCEEGASLRELAPLLYREVESVPQSALSQFAHFANFDPSIENHRF